MTMQRCTLLVALVLLSAPAMQGQANLGAINKQLKMLSTAPMPAMPGAPTEGQPKAVSDDKRPDAVLQLAKDIGSLPAGVPKLKAADALAHTAVQGEAGSSLQPVADTLSQALTETPQPAEKDGSPGDAYMLLAKLVRYAGVKTALSDPMLAKADAVLVANEADAAKADFTLKDLNGKKTTLSALKGKIVLINFWSSACAWCTGKEMQDLDLIYTHYESQGLVVLGITGDNPFRANSYLASKNYHPTVLFDDGGKVGKQFHVDELRPEGLPRTFVFDRDGKLVGVSIDVSTQRQLFTMLGKAGLQPSK